MEEMFGWRCLEDERLTNDSVNDDDDDDGDDKCFGE